MANVSDLAVLCAIVCSGRSPVMLDIFAGVIYWTPWSRDRVRMTENIGRGNTTELLVRQTSIEATRFAHELRYGVDTISKLLFLSINVL